MRGHRLQWQEARGFTLAAMLLSEGLAQAIELEIQKVDRGRLVKAAAQLTAEYQAGGPGPPAIDTPELRAAYLAIRFPATFAANARVFAEIRVLAPHVELHSVLDLGAGPGTALHAAFGEYPTLREATAIETEGALLELGRRIAAQSSFPALRNTRWLRNDLRNEIACGVHDLVVISYALGELPRQDAENVVLKAWKAAGQFLVIVEPGTMKGFGVVNAVRSLLVRAGAHLLAPCPHENECPMAAGGDWCHFSARLERTSTHRQLKAGTLGHEDEKFSYVVASRQALRPAGSRIVRHPQKHSGHVQLALCTAKGLERRTVVRSQKEEYKKARKAEWGDEWMP